MAESDAPTSLVPGFCTTDTIRVAGSGFAGALWLIFLGGGEERGGGGPGRGRPHRAPPPAAGPPPTFGAPGGVREITQPVEN